MKTQMLTIMCTPANTSWSEASQTSRKLSTLTFASDTIGFPPCREQLVPTLINIWGKAGTCQQTHAKGHVLYTFADH